MWLRTVTEVEKSTLLRFAVYLIEQDVKALSIWGLLSLFLERPSSLPSSLPSSRIELFTIDLVMNSVGYLNLN